MKPHIRDQVQQLGEQFDFVFQKGLTFVSFIPLRNKILMIGEIPDSTIAFARFVELVQAGISIRAGHKPNDIWRAWQKTFTRSSTASPLRHSRQARPVTREYMITRTGMIKITDHIRL
jgi:hypothetical protein